MFPSGMNPLVNVTTGLSRKPREPQDRKDRIDVAVKYLYFDFGESLSFPSFEERGLALPAGFHAYPEMNTFNGDRPKGQESLHDPFPQDIHVLSTEFKESFYKVNRRIRLLILLLRHHHHA